MAKPPFFPFYPNDYLADRAVAQLTLEEQGAYLNLLCYQWQDPACGLPADDGVLMYLSRAGDRWSEIGSKLLRLCFVREGGVVYNPRLRREWELYRAKVDAGRKGGTKSGQSRRKGVEAEGKQKPSRREAKANHSDIRYQSNNPLPPDDDKRAVVEAYNSTLGGRLNPADPRVLEHAGKALASGKSVADMRRVFEAVRDGTTEAARWARDHNKKFSYVARVGLYRSGKSGLETDGAADVILSQLPSVQLEALRTEPEHVRFLREKRERERASDA